VTYAEVLAAIADPTRRLVLERLRAGPQAVGRLAQGLDVTRPAVSQHLRVLARAGLVRARRQGTRRIYSVEVRGLRELRRYLDGFWDDVLSAFAAGGGSGPATSAVPRRRAAAPAARRPRRSGRKGR
jgi:DNA-binding transcriptional ArsR family regulator